MSSMLSVQTVAAATETTEVTPSVVDTVSHEVEQTTSILSNLFQPFLDKLPELIFAVIFLAVGYFLVKQVMRILRRAFERSNMDGIMASFVRSIIKIILYVLLVVIALSILDVPMDSIVAVIASAGVAVGLALKDSLSNLAGGFIILFSKPMKEGDTVEVDGVVGKIEAISILYTRIVTLDNKTVSIPNGMVSSSKIINYTDKELRRVDVPFSISYDSDVDKARAVMLDVVRAEPKALEEPAPEVNVVAHNDSAVTLRLQVWTKSENHLWMQYRMLEDVKKAFDANGISIPYPQVDVHFPENTGKSQEK
ncbi:MAG: mechanosensitive ion channel family protein [Ruminococcus sp.]